MKKIIFMLFTTFAIAWIKYASMPRLYNWTPLINKAISVSPKLSMLRAKRNVARDKIPQESNLPNPMLILGLMNIPTNSFSFDQEPMTQKVIGLQQTYSLPGKLSAMEDAAVNRYLNN